MALVKREEKLAFIGVTTISGETQTITYHRMKNFTEFSFSKNPVEYTRRYIDECAERTDVTGYAPSISYAFDQESANNGQKVIVDISDGEMTGASAVVSIITVDLSATAVNSAYPAKKRDFTVVPDSDGDSTDAYTYSGTLKANGDSVAGTATTSNEWDTCTFVATI